MPLSTPFTPPQARSTRRLSILGIVFAALLLAGGLLALDGFRQIALAQSPDDVLYVRVGGSTTSDCKRDLIPAVPPNPAFYDYSAACELNYAIQQARANQIDALWIAAGDYVQSVVLTKSITLVGGFPVSFVSPPSLLDPVADPLVNRTRILGAANLPAITVEAPVTTTVTRTVSLNGLYVQHQTSAAGQGISVTVPISPNLSGLRVDLTVTNSWLQTHTTTAPGGGLVVDPRLVARIGVTGTLFSGNQAGAGGAIWLPPGSRLYGDNTRFLSNVATTGHGGALHLNGVVAATLTNAVFTGNQATAGDGGAVYAVDTTLSLAGSMTGNRAGGSGGGIAATGGTVTLNDLLLTGNTAQVHGGALYRAGGDLTLSNNQVMTNTAATGSGGGIAVTGAGTVNLTGVSWLNNQAGAAGGAARISAATVTLSNSPQLRNNRAVNGGGAYLSASSSINIANNALARDNQATGGAGGAFYVDGAGTAAATIANNTVVTNTADVGGGLFISGTVGGTLGPNVLQYNRALVGSGGALYVMNSRGLTVAGLDLQRNTAQQHGGGAYLDRSDLDAGDAVIEFNQALTGDGGGLYLAGGGALNVTGALTIRHNRAQANGGGAAGSGGSLSVIGAATVFSNTATTGSGGGLALRNGGGFTVTGVSTLQQNIAQTNGGALYMEIGSLALTGGGAATDNRAETGSGGAFYLTNSVNGSFGALTLQNNRAQVGAGALAAVASTLNFVGHTQVLGNTAVTGDGGGLHLTQSVSATVALATVNNNTANINGGGVYAGDTELALGAGSTINNNVAPTGSGGGLYLTGAGSLTTTGAITVQGNRAHVDGGGLYALSNVRIANAVIHQNTATTGRGGGVFGGNGGITLNSTSVMSNSAQIDGGGIYVTNAGSLVIENASIVSRNQITTGYGGGIRSAGAAVTVRGSTIANNHAYLGGGGVYQTGGSLTVDAGATVNANTTANGGGGGLAVISGTVVISASVVSQNTAPDNGGGLYAPGGNVTLRNGTTIHANTAISGSGGGVYVNGVSLDADNTTFSDNMAATGGGGVYVDALFARIAHSSLTGNNGGKNYTLNGPGGAAFLSADLVELVGNLIENNQTSGSGGALALVDTDAATIISNTIRANTVRQDVRTDSTVLTEDVVIAQTGRVVATKGSTVSTQKKTEAKGGGLYIVNSSAVFDKNIIQGNRNASGDGGGLFVSSSAITMTNNVVAQNTTAISTTYAAGLYISSSSATLHHLTIADNINASPDDGALGMGIYVTGNATDTSKIDLANSIISGHQLGLVLITGSTAALRHNLFSNIDSNWDGAGLFEPAFGNRIGDPRFVDGDNGDYHIRRTSAAFDLGLDIGVATDIEGVPRLRAFGVDAGAYEQVYPQGVHFKVTASPQFVSSDEIIEYQLQLVNHSAGPLSGVGLNFALPSQQVASSISGPGCSGTSCSFPTLAVNDSVAVTFRAATSGTPPDQGFIEMVTTVNVTGVPGPDLVASDVTRTVTTRLQRCRIQYAGVDYPTLQAAADAVNDFDDLPDTIRMAGYCGGSVNITKKMTIQGGWNFSMNTLDPSAFPTTLDAANTGRVMKITNDIAPTIENLTLRNGSASGQGGAQSGKDAGGVVFIQDAKATLRNVLITGGSSPGYGGCVAVASLTAPTIIDSIIESCGAGEGGGGLYANDGSPQVINTVIRNNTAKAGGGVYFRKGNPIINGATISNNLATGTAVYLEVAFFNIRLSMGGGGGVSFDESKGAITNSTLEDNTASAGGAVFADNSPGSISNSILRNNQATGSPTIIPVIVLVNIAGGGGAIYAQRSDLVIEYNRIEGNTSAGPGGGIHIFNGTADGKINGNFIGFNSADTGSAVYAFMDPDVVQFFFFPFTFPPLLIPFLMGQPQPEPPKLTLYNNTIAHNLGSSAVHFVGSSQGELVANIFAFNTGTGIVAETQVLPWIMFVPVPIIITIPIPFPVFFVPKVNANYTLWHENGGQTSSVLAPRVGNDNERNGDPAFKNDGYHIKRISAAYNTGKNTGIPVDLDGQTRPQADITDVGADEYPALGVRYVAPGGPDTGGNFCRDFLNPCGSLQVAIDSAREGDLIKMAGGTYSGVTTRLGQTQMGFITKTLTIQGGYYRYTTDNDVTDGRYTDHDWEDPHQDVNPTILDAGGAGRIFYILDEKRLDNDGNPIKVEPTLAGLVLRNGNATGQKGTQGNLFDAGGAIYLDTTTATLRDLEITNSLADFGGGVYLISSTVQLDDVIVRNNQANERGGGFYLDNSDQVAIRAITIEQNKAPRGAGLYLNGSDATLQSNVISGNGDSATTLAGGGLYLDGSAAQVISNTLTANIAANGGGFYVVNSGAQIKGNTVTNNRSLTTTAGNGRGGGCYLGPGAAIVTQNTLQANEAIFGGGCYLEDSAAVMTANQVLSNIARTSGGGLYLNDSSDASVRLNTVNNNAANGAGENDGGGGLYLESSNSAVQENAISGNQGVSGGGVYLFSFSNASLLKNTITQNGANRDGGGVYIKLSNANLTENTITANATVQGNGGGVYVKLSGAQLTKNTVNDNTASLAGGGVYLDESGAALQEDSVQGNRARNGGGVYLFRSNTARFSKVTIRNNQADLNGGGLYLNLSNIPLEDHVIEDNTAGAAGGGLYLEESVVSLNRNILRRNQAGERGGGVAITKRSHATLGSNAIVDNRAGTTGSGVYVAGSRPTLIHTTVARNAGGDGTGVVAETREGAPSAVTLVNSILANQDLAVRAAAGNTISLTATLWDGNQLNWKLDAGAILTGSANLNFFGAARFEADGIHLQKDSKAVSVGVMTTVSRDIDGDGRPQGNGPELGADELPADCAAVASSDLNVTYTTVQAAVDAARPGDEVRIAGTCVGAITRGDGLTQLALIDKQITVRGGYTPTNWLVSYPITQPTFLDAKGAGRVIYVAAGFNPLIESLNLANGTARNQGGGPGGLDGGGLIYVRNANPTLRNLTLVGGEAYYGGALYLQSSTATLTDSKLEGNTGTKGGAVFLRNANATLRNNTVVNNLADSGAGLFLSFSQAIIDGNTVVQNAATAAGGGFFLESSAATIRSNLVATNTALSAGGVYVDGAAPQLIRNTIQGNTGQNAGGLYLSGSTAIVNGNIVLRNSAGIGGGVYIQAGQPVLDNNVIAQNTGQTQAAGLYILSSSPKLRHNTLAANSGGDGSGLYITDVGANPANIDFVNNIVVDHTTAISITAGNKISVRSTLWNNNGRDWIGDGLVVDQGGHVREDPRVVNAAGGDYHLQNSSPARDRGAGNAGVDVDFDGQARPADQGFDIGADEFVFLGIQVVAQTVPEPVVAGAPFSFVIRIVNIGNIDQTASVTVTLPNQMTPSGVLSWTTPIRRGDTWVQTLNAQVISSFSGQLTALLDVTTAEGEAQSLSVPIAVAKPDFAVLLEAEAAPSPAIPGSELVYQIRVSNVGNQPINPTVNVELPTPVSTAATLSYTPDPLGPNGAWTKSLHTIVAPDAAGTLQTVFRVTTVEGPSSTVTLAVPIAQPGLATTVAATPDPVLAGRVVSYTVKVANTGNIDFTGTVTFVVPTAANGRPLVAPGADQVYRDVALPAGGEWTQTLVFVVEPGYTGELVSRVVVATNTGLRTDLQDTRRVVLPGQGPTIRAVRTGPWNDPNTWDPARVPNPGDIAQVEEGVEVTVDATPNPIQLTGLINRGTIFLNCAAGEAMVLAVTDFIENTGLIRGADARAIGEPGCPIEVQTLTLNNPGVIRGGDGADGGLSSGVFFDGGDGGPVSVFIQNMVNDGTIRGGDGGNVPPPAASGKGGDGGHALVVAGPPDPGLIINRNLIEAGDGGDGPNGGDGGAVGLLASSQLTIDGGQAVGGDGGEGRDGGANGADGGVTIAAAFVWENGVLRANGDDYAFSSQVRSRVRGVAGATVLLPVEILNTGLNHDTYLLLWTVDQAWAQAFLPQTFRVRTLRMGRLLAPFQIPLDAQNRDRAVVNIAVSSRGDLTLVQERTITVVVGEGDRILMPTIYGSQVAGAVQSQTPANPPAADARILLPVVGATTP